MRLKIAKVSFLIAAFLLPGFLQAQVDYTVTFSLDNGYNNSDEIQKVLINTAREGTRNFYSNWLEGNLRYKNWRLGARMEMHLPPQTFDPDQAVRRTLEHRFLEYNRGTWRVRGGTNYTLMGRGLTLRMYEERQLRYDTKLDGLYGEYLGKRIDIKAMVGQPVLLSGVREDFLQAAEVRVKAYKSFQVGGTAVNTHFDQVEDQVQWGSLFSQVNTNYGDFYAEYARKYLPGQTANGAPDGEALYLNSNVLLGSVSFSLEYKSYDLFKIEDPVGESLKKPNTNPYNNPPLVSQDHLFTLLNRRQLIQNANSEEGYLVEATLPVADGAILKANYSITDNKNGARIYEEVYSQFEWTTDTDREWEFLLAGSQQKDIDGRFLNGVFSTGVSLSDYNSLKLVYEHQHVKLDLANYVENPQYYNHLFSAGFSRAPGWTLAFLGERTTKPENLRSGLAEDDGTRKKVWGGLQLDLSLFDKVDMTLFGGTRRGGKVCIGGVCVFKPPLEGVEVTLTARL
ncbi:MAG: DUF6029 family protein [Calditrichia bacterium]